VARPHANVGQPIEQHPLLSIYGPHDVPWRRILVIGREPNDFRPMGTTIGYYALHETPHTAFWARSHAAASRAAGFPSLPLRWYAVQKKCSPLAYTDASPKSYAVGEGGTLGPRPSVTNDELEAHAQRLLELPEALVCPVVLVSGCRPEWQVYYDVVLPALAKNGAAIAKVPFFGRGKGNDNESIDEAIQAQPPVRAAIRHCIIAWATANDIMLPDSGARYICLKRSAAVGSLIWAVRAPIAAPVLR